MQFFTLLGNEAFYLLVAPALYWCIDAVLGLRLGIYLMISGSLNAVLKIVFHGPRPYWYDTQVRAFSTETSFGIPSGHAQNAVVVWGTIATYIQRSWAWISAIILIFLTSLSRVYLGVHFPSDVIAGWLVGALLLWILISIEKPCLTWLNTLTQTSQVVVIFSASLVIIFLGYLATLSLGDWQIPIEWIENAARAAPDAISIEPLSFSGLISNSGAFFGLASGAVVLWKQGGLDAGGPLTKRILRYILGVIGVVVLWLGLRHIFPGGNSLMAHTLRYLRYALIGFWVTGLGPILFIKLDLASPLTGVNDD